MKEIFFSAFFFLLLFTSQAQDAEKTTIAVLPFVNGSGTNTSYASVVQDYVTKEIIKGQRFDILDRSKFKKVLEELNIQKSEEFINSKIVEQGKLSGAQYIVTGVLTHLGTNKSSNTIVDTKGRPTTTETWNAEIKFSFQVIDVATSRAALQENFSGVSSANTSEIAAQENAQCKVNKQVKYAIMKLFPQEIEIISIEKSSKKGMPEEVLISAGTNYFGENFQKGDECSGVLNVSNMIGGLFKKETVRFKVYEVETMTVNGKSIKRERELGKLSLKKVEGDVSICDVNDGEKQILDKLNAKQRILVKII